MAPSRDGPPVNEEITVAQVRLVGANGEMMGVFTRDAAMREAEAAGLDLVMVSPTADPPVCCCRQISRRGQTPCTPWPNSSTC